jgi:dihydrofolate reductase
VGRRLKSIPGPAVRRIVERARSAVETAGASTWFDSLKGNPMSRLRVSSFSISLDGYGAGPHQSLENPLGVGGMGVHEWVLGTRTFQQMHGGEGGATGVDDDFAVRGFANIGAWILGRNMFGPVRGPWPDDAWKGWWGDNPPYHVPVFVLTHHARAPIEMEGGTVFHFVTDGIQAAWARAQEAAGEKDVRLGGGVSTIRQYLRAGLVDEMHLAIAPTLLGSGEALLAGIDLPALGFRCTEHVATPKATHVVLTRPAHAT